MRAITCGRYGGVKVLKINELPIPTIGEAEILVKVSAASINPVDWKIRRGKVIAKTGLKPPKVLGSDFAGIVSKVGDAITHYQVGDRVWGKVDSFKGGAYAEYIQVTENNISLIPNGLSEVEAASIPNVGLTAYQALIHKARLKEGHKVLINGASGGVGVMAIQIAKAMNCHVTAVCSAKNSELVKSLGADEVVDYTAQDSLGGKFEFDIVFDCVAKLSFLKVRKNLKAGGCYVTTIPSLETLLMGPLFKYLGLKCAQHIMVKPSHSDLLALKNLIENKQLNSLIDQTYPMDAVADAHLKSESGRVVGKLVMQF